MSGKGVRNWIITLVILAGGIKLLTMIAKGYIGSQILPAGTGLETLPAALDSISNLVLIGIGIIIIILIPIYLSKRSDDKKKQGQEQPVKK